MSNFEAEILENARFYQTNPPELHKGQASSKWDTLYKANHQHLIKSLLPQLKAASELFIEYWPAYFLWGDRQAYQRGIASGQTYLYRYGTFATGYLCLSDQNVYLAAFAKMTEMFPRYATGGTGFALRVLGRMGGEDDSRKPTKEDKIWKLSYSSLLAAEIAEDKDKSETLFLRTSVENWHVHEHFTGTLEDIRLAVNMGIRNKFTTLSQKNHQSASDAPANGLNRDQILDLIQKLNDLKNAGAITEIEFEQKKQELLSRL